jgi:peptidoglycan/LPS O-acetylase OafA/YrhL
MSILRRHRIATRTSLEDSFHAIRRDIASSAFALSGRKAAAVAATSQHVGSRSLVLVQVLRAIAATLVLVGHSLSEARQVAVSSGARVPVIAQFPGGFGVDLFFVISGFIMVVSSDPLFGTAPARRVFLTRRAIRLVPLYWVVTLAFVPILLAGSRGYDGNLCKALVTSLGFIPYPTYGIDGSNNVYPLYSLGWTLNYEMFFYLLFSVFIVARRGLATAGVVAALVVIVGAGALFGPAPVALRFWAQPIILEFGLGLTIGSLWLGRWQLDWRVCFAVACCAVCVVAVDPLQLAVKVGGNSTPNDFVRVLGWGLPAAALLLAGAFLEKSRGFAGRFIAALRLIGDSSYCLYLLHPFVLLIIMGIWKHVHTGPVGLFFPLGAVVALSYGLAILTHLRAERPVTRGLQRYFGTRPG